MSDESFKIMAQRQHDMQKDSYPRSVIQWLKLKRYQLEVTIPLYMLTPTERLIFYLVILAFMSLFFMAAFFYLPSHISVIRVRAWYYLQGSTVTSTIADAVKTTRAVLSHQTPDAAIAMTTQHVLNEL